MRPILFFGTPEFAVPTLEALAGEGLPIALVVTQPDRPAGRGGRRRSPPVAQVARRLGLELAQPRRVRGKEFLERAAALEPALGVVVAFGQIFPGRLLRLPALGCINLHASLLPRWRGASPITAAIAAGDRVTGVTTMQMEKRLDAGPILLQREVAIGERETTAELSPRLAAAGAELMVDTVRAAAAGELVGRPQRESLATYAPMLERADGRVDWRLDARTLSSRLRAFTPWPGLHAELSGRPVKLLAAEPLSGPTPPGPETLPGEGPPPDPGAPPGHETTSGPGPPAGDTAAAPGTIEGLRQGLLVVACGDGSRLGIARLQRPGGRPLAAADFLNGERIAPGDRFG